MTYIGETLFLYISCWHHTQYNGMELLGSWQLVFTVCLKVQGNPVQERANVWPQESNIFWEAAGLSFRHIWQSVQINQIPYKYFSIPIYSHSLWVLQYSYLLTLLMGTSVFIFTQIPYEYFSIPIYEHSVTVTQVFPFTHIPYKYFSIPIYSHSLTVTQVFLFTHIPYEYFSIPIYSYSFTVTQVFLFTHIPYKYFSIPIYSHSLEVLQYSYLLTFLNSCSSIPIIHIL